MPREGGGCWLAGAAPGPLRVGDGRPRVGERKWASQGWGTKVGLHRVGTKRGLSGLRRRRRVSRVLRGAPGFASRAARQSDPAGRLQSESIAVKGHASLGVSLECETPSPRPARFARLGFSSYGCWRQACELLARMLGAVVVCFKVVRRGVRAGRRCFGKATESHSASKKRITTQEMAKLAMSLVGCAHNRAFPRPILRRGLFHRPILRRGLCYARSTEQGFVTPDPHRRILTHLFLASATCLSVSWA